MALQRLDGRETYDYRKLRISFGVDRGHCEVQLGRTRYGKVLHLWRQCGRLVRVPDLKSGGPGFKSRSDHYLDLFSVVPSSTPRSCLYIANWFASCQLGFLTSNMLCLFSICFIYTAPQASGFKHKLYINKVALPFTLFTAVASYHQILSWLLCVCSIFILETL